MIRRLMRVKVCKMREILGAENLIKMSPTGRGGHKEIPSLVKSAIFRNTVFINSIVRRNAFRIIITIYQIIKIYPVSGKYTIKHYSTARASLRRTAATRRTVCDSCGCIGRPRVYKTRNSTVQVTLYEGPELQGLPCF